MIGDKIFAHFFLDLEVLPIDSELLLTCQSLVMSKEDDLVAGQIDLFSGHLLIASCIKDHKDSFRSDAAFISWIDGEVRTLLWFNPKVGIAHQVAILDLKMMLRSKFIKFLIDLLQVYPFPLNREIMRSDDFLEHFATDIDVGGSRDGHQYHGWEDGNGRKAHRVFLHTIDEVRDRDHVVGLVIIVLLFLKQVQEDGDPSIKE